MNGAAVGVVAAIDTRMVAAHHSSGTAVVDPCFIHIARHVIGAAIGTTENTIYTNGGYRGYVDDRTTRDAFHVATTIDITATDVTAEQVDDSRNGIGVTLGCFRIDAHAETTAFSCTKDHEVIELSRFCRDVDKDITAILHDVHAEVKPLIVICRNGDTLSGTVDTLGLVEWIVADDGTEIDEGIAEAWLGEVRFVATVVVSIFFEKAVRIVVGTVTTAEDIIYTALLILDIGCCLGAVVFVVDIILDVGDFLPDAAHKVF